MSQCFALFRQEQDALAVESQSILFASALCISGADRPPVLAGGSCKVMFHNKISQQSIDRTVTVRFMILHTKEQTQDILTENQC